MNDKHQSNKTEIKYMVTVLLSLYRGEKFLDGYLNSFLSQTWLDKSELVIIHNDPLETELAIIKKYEDQINIVYLPRKRESMYASLNAGISESSGKYLTIWNVDDLRTPHSLEILATALENDSSIGWCYGDFGVTKRYGDKDTQYVSPPIWSFEDGTSGSIGGPFFMFRKNLINKIGLFDEQFYSGGDFEYTVRMSLVTHGVRVNGLLGHFLNERKGLSTAGDLQLIERSAIQIRYGIWKGFDLSVLDKAFQYKPNLVLNNGIWINIQSLIPDFDQLLKGRKFNLRSSIIFTLKESIRKFIKKKVLNYLKLR